MDKWTEKMCGHAMEYYPAIKMSEILAFTVQWTELENIMFNEVSQTQKDKHCIFSLLRGSLRLDLITPCCVCVLKYHTEPH
jgi:hypothetical protein